MRFGVGEGGGGLIQTPSSPATPHMTWHRPSVRLDLREPNSPYAGRKRSDEEPWDRVAQKNIRHQYFGTKREYFAEPGRFSRNCNKQRSKALLPSFPRPSGMSGEGEPIRGGHSGGGPAHKWAVHSTQRTAQNADFKRRCHENPMHDFGTEITKIA